jgi:hypothetical protein
MCRATTPADGLCYIQELAVASMVVLRGIPVWGVSHRGCIELTGFIIVEILLLGTTTGCRLSTSHATLAKHQQLDQHALSP